MKKIILLSLLTALTYTAGAQTPNWLWAESGPGNGYGYCSDIAIGPNDTVYIAGRTGGNLTLGNLSLNTFNTIPFVGKYDSSGATNNNGIWLSDNYPISGFAYSDALCVDNAGSSYITSCDGSGNSIFIEKYNRSGNMSWYSNYFGGNNRGYGISADNLGHVYSSGNFSSTMGVGSITLPTGGSSWAGYLIKQDTAGNVKWATYFASSGYFVGGRRCATDNFGNVYVVGSYKGAAQFYNANLSTYITAPTATASSAFGDLFVVKYDSTGTALWVQDVPNAGMYDNMYYYASSIAVDSCGNLYVAGIFDATATFGSLPPVTPTGTFDAFVAKFNTGAMAWEWVQTGDGTSGSTNYAGNIALDKNSDVYLCGSYSGSSLSFGANTISGGNNFITKFSNSTGDFQYVINANLVSGGISGIATDNKNYLYVDGSYGGTSTLGTATLTGGGGSVFLAKLDTIPPRTIVPSVDSSYCPGETTSIGYTIQGTFNSGNTFTAQLSDSAGTFVNPTQLGQVTSTAGGIINITIPAGTPPGTYLIRVISSNPATSSWANGCGAYYSQNVYTNNFYITIGSNTKLSITASADTICAGGSVKLIAHGGSSYMWGNGATTDSIIVNPIADSTFTVSTTGSCSGSASITLIVNSVLPLVITPPSPVSECNGEGIVLTVPASGNDYTWSPATGLSATTGSSVLANPTADITYTVTGIDSLGCAVEDSEVIDIQLGPSKPIITVSTTGDTLFSSAANGNQWFLNGTAVHGAIDSIFVVKGLPNNDSITVSVTNVANGCSTTSDVFITGINPLVITTNQLSIYPNPTNGLLNINISASAIGVKDWSLRLVDVLGRTLYTQASLNYKNEIDLSGLPGGVYFITVVNKTSRAVFPVIKQN